MYSDFVSFSMQIPKASGRKKHRKMKKWGNRCKFRRLVEEKCIGKWRNERIDARNEDRLWKKEMTETVL